MSINQNRVISELTRNSINTIFDDIDRYDLTEDEMANIKTKIKEAEKRIKEKNKPKTITISGGDHNTIKDYCFKNDFNIGEWASNVLLKEIERDKKEKSCIIEEKDGEKLLEMEKEDITKRYLKNLRKSINFVKSNKIVVNQDFKFAGYSIVDACPIYEFVGNMVVFNIINQTDEMGINLKPCYRTEISKSIFENIDLEVVSF